MTHVSDPFVCPSMHSQEVESIGHKNWSTWVKLSREKAYRIIEPTFDAMDDIMPRFAETYWDSHKLYEQFTTHWVAGCKMLKFIDWVAWREHSQKHPGE